MCVCVCVCVCDYLEHAVSAHRGLRVLAARLATGVDDGSRARRYGWDTRTLGVLQDHSATHDKEGNRQDVPRHGLYR